MDTLEAAGWTRFVMIIRTLMSAIGVVVYGAIAWWGVPNLRALDDARAQDPEHGDPDLAVPAILIIAFAMLAIVCLFQLYQDVRALMGKRSSSGPRSEEGIEI